VRQKQLWGHQYDSYLTGLARALIHQLLIQFTMQCSDLRIALGILAFSGLPALGYQALRSTGQKTPSVPKTNWKGRRVVVASVLASWWLPCGLKPIVDKEGREERGRKEGRGTENINRRERAMCCIWKVSKRFNRLAGQSWRDHWPASWSA
jgi:hypothetical protein